jgi:hypothetical protein
MSADRQPQKSSRGWIFLVVRWAAALLILGILFYLLPVAPLRSAPQEKSSPGWIFAAGGLRSF